ncbi:MULTISPECIES: hypothetical protein [Micromonospora]|uniref:hypothetical protein n=1 Tax=Micromonospora TaxID=1873 RepID=UPI0007DB27F6|nr:MULTISPECIES: hypothetical protein [Micromonospora]MBC8991756.1 hypothetical protein [Micromonospora chalcea]MBP1783605.1 hypothetical protein [Micromonospora sp. HB375]MDH6469255.1 hypothetical protein [Micromonospora sp. H404/HB375]NHO84788.1 hypothetical protein [Micromonospora sp. CMU55-4]PPA59103.1 hypothetical protein BAW75_17715 [Micromonospora chalcea]
MLVAVIVGCEVAFWVVLLAGLIARYPLRRPRLGAALLIAVPVVDLVLLAATMIDLRRGATATFAHGLAAAYLGFSVAFGHSMVRWADERFAHRFAGGPPPRRAPKYGMARARHEWREWGKGMIGWAVACAVLLGGIALVGDGERTAELWAWAGRLTVVMAGWLVFWPVAYTVFPKRAPRDA